MAASGSAPARATGVGDVARLGPALAVVAHPDDESFGLGAVLAALVAQRTEVRVLCLTYGEASTLGAADDLSQIRRAELDRAAQQLGITHVDLQSFPDGGLIDIAPDIVDRAVDRYIGDAALVVVFEPGGVTGHPDHRAATASACRVAARRGLTVLEWGVTPAVAAALNAAFGTTFTGLTGLGTFDIEVDRGSQLAAIACHQSQASDNPVLVRRLHLAGDRERLRLRRPQGPQQEVKERHQ
jgi:LmbE family N-acetylglucosaminyl deacetylase